MDLRAEAAGAEARLARGRAAAAGLLTGRLADADKLGRGRAAARAALAAGRAEVELLVVPSLTDGVVLPARGVVAAAARASRASRIFWTAAADADATGRVAGAVLVTVGRVRAAIEAVGAVTLGRAALVAVGSGLERAAGEPGPVDEDDAVLGRGTAAAAAAVRAAEAAVGAVRGFRFASDTLGAVGLTAFTRGGAAADLGDAACQLCWTIARTSKDTTLKHLLHAPVVPCDAILLVLTSEDLNRLSISSWDALNRCGDFVGSVAVLNNGGGLFTRVGYS